jgi:hypothetical protein
VVVVPSSCRPCLLANCLVKRPYSCSAKKKSDRSEPTTQESIYEADDHKSVWNLISRESVQALLHQRILELLV